MPQWVIMLILFVVSIALTPRPKIQDAEAGSLEAPKPRLGSPLGVIFGEVWIDDAAISYFGNPSTVPIRKSSK